MRLGENKYNLIYRFLLELAALTGYGYWGWAVTTGWVRYLLMILFPFAAALAWGVFAVPDDPSRSGKAPVVVPGWLRFALELGIFGLASFGWIHLGKVMVGCVFSGLVLVHYLLSIDRIKWLIRSSGKR